MGFHDKEKERRRSCTRGEGRALEEKVVHSACSAVCSVACSDGGYQEYRLTLMHFTLDKEVELVVKKTGGTLCQLNSDAVHFHSSVLLVSASG